MSILKTPLSYPGGKFSVADKLYQLFPYFDEYREPFVGGGSVFVHTKQRHPNATYWINDKWDKTIDFWTALQADPEALYHGVLTWFEQHKAMPLADGRIAYKALINATYGDDKFAAGVALYLINRLSHGSRFDNISVYMWKEMNENLGNGGSYLLTYSNMLRLKELVGFLDNVKITCDDYSVVLSAASCCNEVFIFCDPPYFTKHKDWLYGDNGELHKEFDHTSFANAIYNCQHKFLITYGDVPEVRDLYRDYYILEYSKNYSFNARAQGLRPELIITNYKIF